MNLRSQFLLDPDAVFLNHGSFGACPKPVFDVYQRWQRELERQPVRFFQRRIVELMAEARAALASYLNCGADEVVYFPNPTTAVNMVARSLELRPGDEILSTDHEYGALDRTWRFLCQKAGASYIRRPIPLPVNAPQDVVEAVWSGVTERTRAVFISHLTSPTALIFPVAEICRQARAAGLLTLVDGAHAPGQLALDLTEVGADLYTGACHKWLCAPKGSAFLYARREIQLTLEPLIVSWGWEAENPSDSTFIDHHEWQGTRDMAAFLAVPDAIRFQRDHDWDAVRSRCHALARESRRRVHALTGLAPICPDTAGWYAQMYSATLPELDVKEAQRFLRDVHQVEVPVFRWDDTPMLRVSVQAYNREQDLDTLLAGLADLLG